MKSNPIYEVQKNKTIIYNLQIIGSDRFKEFIDLAKSKKLKTLDLGVASIPDKLFSYVNELEVEGVTITLSEDTESRYRRLVNGGFFEKQRNPKEYVEQLFQATRVINKNWIIYEDLTGESTELKKIIEILDYGDIQENRPIRYRKLKSHLTQPSKLYYYLQDNPTGYQTCWDIGTWVWGDVLNPYFGVHLPSTEEEYVILEVLRGVFNQDYEF